MRRRGGGRWALEHGQRFRDWGLGTVVWRPVGGEGGEEKGLAALGGEERADAAELAGEARPEVPRLAGGHLRDSDGRNSTLPEEEGSGAAETARSGVGVGARTARSVGAGKALVRRRWRGGGLAPGSAGDWGGDGAVGRLDGGSGGWGWGWGRGGGCVAWGWVLD